MSKARVDFSGSSLGDIIKNFDNRQMKYALTDVMYSTVRPMATKVRKRYPKGEHGKGFGKSAHKAGTVRRGVKVKKFSSNIKVPGAWIGIPGGSQDHFYAFHNTNPLTNRGGRGQIKQPWPDYVQEVMNDNLSTLMNAAEPRIFKVVGRHVKKYVKRRMR